MFRMLAQRLSHRTSTISRSFSIMTRLKRGPINPTVPEDTRPQQPVVDQASLQKLRETEDWKMYDEEVDWRMQTFHAQFFRKFPNEPNAEILKCYRDSMHAAVEEAQSRHATLNQFFRAQEKLCQEFRHVIETTDKLLQLQAPKDSTSKDVMLLESVSKELASIKDSVATITQTSHRLSYTPRTKLEELADTTRATRQQMKKS
eukprot:c18498_g1_i1.p1 GENE.c18498_g1_i1~~c18498_g1_i1.p1  ORF type:complete len:219 (+),score=30.98 c18498_g1_i1:49-657(+)